MLTQPGRCAQRFQTPLVRLPSSFFLFFKHAFSFSDESSMEVESNDVFLFPWLAYEEFRGTKIYIM